MSSKDKTTGSGFYGVLIAVESARVKPGIRPAHPMGMGGSACVRGIFVSEVDVICPEVGTSKGRIFGDRETRGAGPGQGGVQGWPDGQHTGVDVV